MTTHDEQATTAPTAETETSSAGTEPTETGSVPEQVEIPSADDESPMAGPQQSQATNDVTADAEPSDDEALFADDQLSGLRSRWDDVQAAFVDDPTQCVQKADALVAEVVEKLTAGFSEARSHLEAQWARGQEASTEDLRLALRRYREFFQRLLSV